MTGTRYSKFRSLVGSNDSVLRRPSLRSHCVLCGEDFIHKDNGDANRVIPERRSCKNNYNAGTPSEGAPK